MVTVVADVGCAGFYVDEEVDEDEEGGEEGMDRKGEGVLIVAGIGLERFRVGVDCEVLI